MDLQQALRADEGQSIEFKTSLNELQDGIHTLVGFLNSQGGDLFFGVTPDGRPVGVELGRQSVEKLVLQIRERIYPDFPAVIDELDGEGERPVLRITVPRDVPPVIGAYLYSPNALDVRSRVAAKGLQAYRRVGKVSQKIDFMWLRGQLPSDPVVLVDRGGASMGPNGPKEIGGNAWLVPGSGVAHALEFRLDPPLSPPRRADRILPRSDDGRVSRYSFGLSDEGAGVDKLWVIVSYFDDFGCRWESGRLLQGRALEPTSEAFRRIVEFPPKLT